MTRVDFERWMNHNDIPVLRPGSHLVPCDCGDVNCHGWRFAACVLHTGKVRPGHIPEVGPAA